MASFLQSYSRQPKIYVDLPSQGTYYNEKIVTENKISEIPVFGMNTMDELIIKTPDALFSGEATAHIIKSCIPHILDPWKIVSFDIDYILIAIRIATYGELMPITTTCPHCSNSAEHDINLPNVLGQLSNNQLPAPVMLEGLKIELRPLTYKEQTDFSKQNFTLQKKLVQIEKLPDDNKDKDELRQDIFNEMTQLAAEIGLTHVHNISNGNDVEFNFLEIKHFLVTNDSMFFNAVQDRVKEMNDSWSLPEITVTCINEECGKDFKTKINVDYSSFFGNKSLSSRNLTL